jgi:hypothetical protein
MTCLRSLIVLACAASLYAQAPAGSTPPAGLETSWEIAPVLKELAEHANRLVPLLDKLRVDTWVAKGASDTYAAQLQSSREQAQALAIEARALSANPEKLAASLQVLFRLQALDNMIASLADGVRRYQNARDAQELTTASAQSGASRDRLQRYIVNLAGEREHDLEIMDREAQRCRGILTQAPPKGTRKK